MISLRSVPNTRRLYQPWAHLRLETFEDRTVPAVAIGANFPGVGTDAFPPLGNSGAIGPDHYVEMLTGGFVVYDRDGNLLQLDDDNTFWNNAGIPTTDTNRGVFEPHVVYDPLSDTWFAIQITNTAAAGQTTINKMLVARSDTPDPTGTWTALSYIASTGFADIPTLAVDANGVYIGTTNFTDINETTFLSVTLTSIPKADLLLPTPTIARRTTREDVNFTLGYAIQGVSNFNANPAHASVVAVDLFSFNFVDRTTITGTGGANAQFGPTTQYSVGTMSLPGLARQPDGTRDILGGFDHEMSGAIYQVGDLIYAVNSISVDGTGAAVTSGPTTTDAVRLTVISDSQNRVVAQGTFFNTAYDYIFPSVSANQYGDIIIGFTRSGGSGVTDGNLGAYAVYARINPASPTSITFGPEVELQAGFVNNYHQSGVPPELWGFYSSTGLDPTNPLSFWTTQELATTATRWDTQVSQIFVSPRAISASSPNPNGIYHVGDSIDITVTFNNPVNVLGEPELALNSGGVATFFDGSGTDTLTFTYTVAPGDSATDLDYLSATALNLNGGTIVDAFSELDAELDLPAPGTPGSLGANKNIVIETRARVTGVSSPIPDGTYGATSVIAINVTFDQAMVVTGAPQLALNSGGVATYSIGSGTNTLTFTYTVGAGQNSPDLDYSSANALTLNGGTIKDQFSGQDAILTLPAPGGPGSLGANNNIKIDTTDPRVTGVSSPAADGLYRFNETILITVTFHKAVAVSGTPQLALNSGGTATYQSGSGETVLMFTYTVGAGQSSPDLDYTSANALTLNGGTITEVGSGQNASLTLPVPGAAGSLAANKNIVIDAISPTVTNVTSAKPNGLYIAGEIIDITVKFSKPVDVSGTPLLALNSGGTASYFSGSGTDTLTFRYTVGAGETTTDLDYASTTALTLNGGTIQESTGLAANLTLPAPGSPGSLGANKNISIDTKGPTVVEFRVLFGSRSYNLIGSSRTVLPWQIKAIQVVFDEPVATGNVQSLTGVTATRFTGRGTKVLTWNFAAISNASLHAFLASSGPNALKDAAGNAISAFDQVVNVLYGDFDGNGFVNAADEAGVRANIAPPYQVNPSRYNIFADLNGDGIVNLADVGIARARKGTSLPS